MANGPGTPELTEEQLGELGRDLDAIRRELIAGLGAADADYIRRIVRVQQRFEIVGRAMLWAGQVRTDTRFRVLAGGRSAKRAA